MAGEVDNAFCAVRPPGHHAEAGRAMGFCLFNNVAIGVAHARAAYGLKRIAIIDFDVHHGNGTQALFGSDPDVFYGSTHQSPLYPGTGKGSENGHVVNKPLEPGTAGATFRHAFADILKALKRFKPEFIFISAGFDAHRDDPLAQLKLEDADFAWATEEVCLVADKICGGRVVSVLEGGYDLPALARSARAHVQALMTA
jgi:acetoin utilization deacetylase AcuC-like enzyme